ncbi:MAG: oxidoreductase [Chitinophagales bacterium]|nr:MAG: oxidoreductase [Chitinophagales bacterium]
MTYQDKIVWITGASSGIGEAVARVFAAEGAHIIISARREKELKRVQAACPDTSRVTVVPLDIADYKNIAGIVTPVIENLGRIDLLFNNAGISQRSLAKDTSLEVYERIMQVNFMGTIAMTKAVLPFMLRQQSGHIAVVTSLTGKFSTPLRTGYAASKHALHGFFDGLRAEVYRDNIAVTIICPGFVKTHVSENALTADGTPQRKMDDAIRTGMDPDYVAKKILRALKMREEEVIIAGREKWGVYIKRFFPSLFSHLIKTAKVT